MGLSFDIGIGFSSTNGIDWTERVMPVSADWNGVTVNPTTGVFVAVAYDSSIAASSPDGFTWTERVYSTPCSDVASDSTGA